MNKYIFTKLFENYQLPLYRYLLQMTRSREHAEELLQETFYRAFVSLSVRDIVQVRAWLFKVARNLYIDSLRKAKTEEKLMEQMKYQVEASTYYNPEKHIEIKSRQEELERILAQLPERMRTILYLREIQELSYKELEMTMNLSAAQVKTTLYRAREKFRKVEANIRKEESTDE